MSVSEIRESFDAWQRARQSREAEAREARDGKGKGKGKARAIDDGQEGTDGPEAGKEGRDGGREVIDPGARDERLASLDVLGVSALEG